MRARMRARRVDDRHLQHVRHGGVRRARHRHGRLRLPGPAGHRLPLAPVRPGLRGPRRVQDRVHGCPCGRGWRV